MAPLEITGGEPHVVGGHGLSGFWIDECRRTSLPGLWAAGDVAGGTPKKYASGAWAEAVIAVRDVIDSLDDGPRAELDHHQIASERARVFAPMQGPRAAAPLELEERLQKIMDEYAGGKSSDYAYSTGELELARSQLARLEEELAALRAESFHELCLCHDVIDRVTVARQLVEHMLHRKETRWHCYQERLDYPDRDDERWMVFVNSRRHPDGRIEMIERPVERASLDVVLPPLADGAVIRRPSARRGRQP